MSKRKATPPPIPVVPRLPVFANLRFQYPFRKYQLMALDLIDSKTKAETQHHIVAPPGAGKTIVGLELIRRIGRPAVVFAPTTTIQRQWQEKMGLFTTDQTWLAAHTSLEASQLADVTFLTYQILSTPGQNQEFVERIALQKWADDLLNSGQASHENEAQSRIETIRQANPTAYRNEISRRYRRIKRDLLGKGQFEGQRVNSRQFLHPNARDLIDRIVALNVGTLILDECHHLLDYWAFILRELIQELPGVQVVGLTATLPDPANEQAYENYYTLLGEVDFEVPTPAVVKEGNLAPYRDLVYFCQPSGRERQFLKRIQDHFEEAVKTVTETPTFQNWLTATILERGGQPFEEFFNQEAVLGTAGIKYLLAQNFPLPDDVIVVDDMLEPMSIDDWLALLESFALKSLKVSSDPAGQTLYKKLRDVLLNFGITITEQGIRHQRSPGDLVLALSEAKDEATVKILQAEMAVIGPKLRAVVITDFERMSASSRRLADVLDPDAGSAVRVFRQIVADSQTNQLDPILVTGNVVLAAANNLPRLDEAIAKWRTAQNGQFEWQWQPTETANISQLTGSGKDWASRTYVALLTDLFEEGISQCLVGTRGIFGEGWDALSLNTLIDLTAVTTSTSVQQIRGRTIRLDPAWPQKAAHNWDVVCYNPHFDKGDADLRRFVARHAHLWGIVYVSPKEAWGNDPAGTITRWFLPGMNQALVARGVAHVDPELAYEIASRPFKLIDFNKYSKRMLAGLADRDRVHHLWGVGQPYANFIYSATQLNPQDIKFRTVYTLEDSLWAIWYRLLFTLLTIFAMMGVIAIQAVATFSGPPAVLCLGLTLTILLGGLVILVANAQAIWRVVHKTFIDLPADAVLGDIGRSLLAALRQTGLVSPNLQDNFVRVVQTAEGGLQIFLDYASPEDSATFAKACQEVMGSISDARYLIERDSSSLRNLVNRPVWAAIRWALKVEEEQVAYHCVPDLLASRKERAEIFAGYWQQWVGGGRLIFTRTAEGRRILLLARSQQQKRPRQLAFELWK